MKILLNDMTYMGDGSATIIKRERLTVCRDNIYAGCVFKLNEKKGLYDPCRKIMFTLNEDGTINDLLFDTPNYAVNPQQTEKFLVTDIVKLGELLKHEYYQENIDYDCMKEIFDAYLTRKYSFYREDHRDLPMTLREYATLEVLSKLSGKPSKKEKKEFEKFKPKAKTYTFR